MLAVKETSSENVIHNLLLQFKTYLQSLLHSMGGRLVLVTETDLRHDVSEKAVGRKLLMKLKIFRGKLIEGVPALIPPNLPENKVESMKTSGREGKKCLLKLLLYLK